MELIMKFLLWCMGFIPVIIMVVIAFFIHPLLGIALASLFSFAAVIGIGVGIYNIKHKGDNK